MRIVAGEFGGRRLAPVPRRGVRPTADPVREALFNILGERVVGQAFVDLGAGTGAVGLEAFSRGARAVFLVERSREALATIRRNVELMAIDPEQARHLVIVAADVLPWLRGPALPALPAAVRFFFADPPYDDPRLARWVAAVAGTGRLAADGLLVVEHRTGRAVDPGPFRLEWSRRYGDSTLTALARA
ncbi:MAG: 16S rRNA (guanine(966)-N(2))-methyltransferase RsmD [Acidobacteria bacterium]|nr:16S rRNA (guanine(966)-N(2))-methyltransferase RsmD [Acidobacteriota bacterium]